MEVGFRFTEVSQMPLHELQGWTLARQIASHEAIGGRYEYETGEWIAPPKPPPRER